MVYDVYDIFDDKQCKNPHIFMLWKAEDTCLKVWGCDRLWHTSDWESRLLSIGHSQFMYKAICLTQVEGGKPNNMFPSPSLAYNGQLTIQTTLNTSDLYGRDSRIFGQEPTRNVRLPQATPGGGGSIAKVRTMCAVQSLGKNVSNLAICV